MKSLGDDDSLLQLAGRLEHEAQDIIDDLKKRGKRASDDERRARLPVAASSFGAAELLRAVVANRRKCTQNLT